MTRDEILALSPKELATLLAERLFHWRLNEANEWSAIAGTVWVDGKGNRQAMVQGEGAFDPYHSREHAGMVLERLAESMAECELHYRDPRSGFWGERSGWKLDCARKIWDSNWLLGVCWKPTYTAAICTAASLMYAEE